MIVILFVCWDVIKIEVIKIKFLVVSGFNGNYDILFNIRLLF